MVKFMMKFIRSKIKVLALFSVISLFGAITSIFIPYYNGKFIDLITISISSKVVITFALFIGIISMLSILSMYIYGIVEAKIRLEISYNMYQSIIDHYQRIPLIIQNKFNSSYLNQRINTDVSIVVNFFLKYYINIFIQSISLIIILFLMFNLNICIGFITIIMIPIYILIYLKFKTPLYEQGINAKEAGAKYFKIGHEQIDATTEIKANSLYESSKNCILKGYEKYSDTVIKYNKIMYIFKCSDDGITTLFKILILLVGGFEVINDNLSLGDFVIVNSYYEMIFNQIKFFLNVGKEYQDTRNSYDRIQEILLIKKETNGSKTISKINSIHINNLSYKYDIVEIIKPITVDLQKGKPYIIKGENGKGKTTLLLLLTNMLKRTSGDIFYNNFNTDDIDMVELREKNISMYVQNSKAFDTTVIENIRYYFNSSKEDILQKIEENNLNRLFLNNGFNINDYFEKNINELSGGERQKINLLCVLLDQKDLLILDEPTSNMDEISSIILSEYLKKISYERIILIVSHDNKFLNGFTDYIELAL